VAFILWALLYVEGGVYTLGAFVCGEIRAS